MFSDWDDPEEDHDLEAPPLQEQRLDVVTGVLLRSGARSVLDLGCGAGDLLARLLPHPQFERIVGLDICPDAVAHSAARLRDLASAGRLRVLQGSFAEPDPALAGFDAAALVETIEHVDLATLPRVEQALFAHHRPSTVVITTPNSEYNVLYRLERGQRRHPDHRFEWTRAQFRGWALGLARQHGYRTQFLGIGEEDPQLGSSTQMVVFSRTR